MQEIRIRGQEVLPGMFRHGRSALRGFGQLPGVTPPGITNSREVIERAYRILDERGGSAEAASIRRVLDKARMPDELLKILVAFQGGAHDAAQKSETAWKQLSIIGTAFAVNIPALVVAIGGWRDTVSNARLQLGTLGTPADKLKKILAGLPPGLPVEDNVKEEATRQVLVYAIYTRSTIRTIELTEENMRQASSPLAALDIARTALENLGKTLGWVLRAAFGAVNLALPNVLGAIPWWVWVVAAGAGVIYLRPLITPFIRRRD